MIDVAVAALLHTYLSILVGPALVKCCQTGKQHCVKLLDLSREDLIPLSEQDLTKGTSLMLEHQGKSYPVTFLKFKGMFCIHVHCIGV